MKLQHIFRVKTLSDVAGICAILLGIPYTLWFEACLVQPLYHQDWNSTVIFHYISAAWISICVFSNWFMCFTTDCSIKTLDKLDASREEWDQCLACACSKPPRAHHCKLCDVCILHRDHHCWFIGTCIGLHNQRFYVGMLVYLCLGGTYGLLYAWDFFWSGLGGFSIGTCFSLLVPHILWTLGYYSKWEFFLCGSLSVGLFFTMIMYVLLGRQLVQLPRAQTQHEWSKGLAPADQGSLAANVQQVLGTRYYLLLFFPFLDSPLPKSALRALDSRSKVL